jgi:hypothetical protein
MLLEKGILFQTGQKKMTKLFLLIVIRNLMLNSKNLLKKEEKSKLEKELNSIILISIFDL